MDHHTSRCQVQVFELERQLDDTILWRMYYNVEFNEKNYALCKCNIPILYRVCLFAVIMLLWNVIGTIYTRSPAELNYNTVYTVGNNTLIRIYLFKCSV